MVTQEDAKSLVMNDSNLSLSRKGGESKKIKKFSDFLDNTS